MNGYDLNAVVQHAQTLGLGGLLTLYPQSQVDPLPPVTLPPGRAPTHTQREQFRTAVFQYGFRNFSLSNGGESPMKQTMPTPPAQPAPDQQSVDIPADAGDLAPLTQQPKHGRHPVSRRRCPLQGELDKWKDDSAGLAG